MCTKFHVYLHIIIYVYIYIYVYPVRKRVPATVLGHDNKKPTTIQRPDNPTIQKINKKFMKINETSMTI